MKYKKLPIPYIDKSIPLGSIVRFLKDSGIEHESLLARYSSTGTGTDNWYYDLFSLSDGNSWGLPQTLEGASKNEPLPVFKLNKLNIIVKEIWVPVANGNA